MGPFSSSVGIDDLIAAFPWDGKCGDPLLEVGDPPVLGPLLLSAVDQPVALCWQGEAVGGSSIDSTGQGARAQVYGTDLLTGLSLSASAADGAGNTLATARNVGSLNGTQSFSDWVGRTDVNDYYRFDLSQASSFTVTLNGLAADADLQLLTSTGSVLASSTQGGTRAESISRSLGAGTYFARVFRYKGNTNYNLALTATATATAPADGAGNTLATARNIGSLAGSQAFSDWVGSSDLDDYYRFDLGQASSFSVTLKGLTADADLQLLSGTGAVLASSENGGSAEEAISRALDAGTYYARVFRYSGDTNYSLALVASATAEPNPGFSAVNGYGEVSVERAIESLLSVSLPDLPGQFSGGLYGLDRIGAPEVWNYGYTGQDMVVAVLDTGVDRSHQDLDANIWTNTREIAGNGIDDDGNGYIDDYYGWNFVSNNNDTLDVYGHGTHVAGTIAAERNSFGITGVAYGAKIMPVKVLSDSGSGSYLGIANGIRYAANNGAHVINLSLGGGSGDTSIRSAVEYAWNRGVAVVMAAGNDGGASPGYPAAYATDWGIAVGAVDSTGAMASFSNRAGSTVLDYVTAAGVSVTSTTPNNSYATWSGTSMATPQTAAAMALLIQANRTSGRNLSIGQLEQLLMATASNSSSSSVAVGSTVPSTTGGSSLRALVGIDLGSDLEMVAPKADADGSPQSDGSAELKAAISCSGAELSLGPSAVDERQAVAASLSAAAPAGLPGRGRPTNSPDQLAMGAFDRSRGGGEDVLDLLTGLLNRSAPRRAVG